MVWRRGCGFIGKVMVVFTCECWGNFVLTKLKKYMNSFSMMLSNRTSMNAEYFNASNHKLSSISLTWLFTTRNQKARKLRKPITICVLIKLKIQCFFMRKSSSLVGWKLHFTWVVAYKWKCQEYFLSFIAKRNIWCYEMHRKCLPWFLVRWMQKQQEWNQERTIMFTQEWLKEFLCCFKENLMMKESYIFNKIKRHDISV